jgi:hypothetical protein
MARRHVDVVDLNPDDHAQSAWGDLWVSKNVVCQEEGTTLEPVLA